MPIRLFILALLLIALVNWAMPPLSPARRRNVARWTLWIAIAAVLLMLLRIGMPLLALAGAAIVAGLRLAMPTLVRLLPLLFVQRLGAQAASRPAPGPTPQPDPRVMTRAEALEILNLREGASREEIQAAYRELIQKVHPDRGGSSYLASKVNRARDVLLG